MVNPGEATVVVVVGVRPDPPGNKENIYYGNLNIGLGGLVRLFSDISMHVKSVGPKHHTSP